MLARAWLAAIRLSSRQAGIVLVYHRLDERTGDPRRELVAPHGAALFGRHLRHLRRRYRVVPLRQLLEAVRDRRRGQRFPISITFDDDYRSNVELAAPLLGRHRLPATFFLCCSWREDASPFWWERLQAAADRGTDLGDLVPEAGGTEELHEVAAAIEALDPVQRDRIDERMRRRFGAGSGAAVMSAEDARRLVHQGFELGFHTRRHHRLTTLDDAQLERALNEGREELDQLAGRRVETFAYPHGKADGRVVAGVRDAGFDYAFTTEPRTVAPDRDPRLLGRVEPSWEPGGLELLLVRALCA